MRPKLLFLLKVLGISLLLFAVWQPLSKVYGGLLVIILEAYDPNYDPSRIIREKWIYTASVFLVPLCSLTIATPQLRILTRLVVIGGGIVVSLILDYVKMRFGLAASYSYVVYFSLKWMSPLAIWVIAVSPFINDIFNPPPKEEPMPAGYICPICGEEHLEVINHIIGRHGKKRINTKKVRRLLAKHPELSV